MHEEVIRLEKEADLQLNNRYKVKCLIKHLKDDNFIITTSNAVLKLRIVEGMEMFATKTINDKNYLFFTVNKIILKDTICIEIEATINARIFEKGIEKKYNFIGALLDGRRFNYKTKATRFFSTNTFDFDSDATQTPRFPEIIWRAMRNLDIGKPQQNTDHMNSLSAYKLNEQQAAIHAAVNNVLTIIEGSAGSGKTHILCEIARQIEDFWHYYITVNNKHNYKTLVLCTQDSAADNCLQKLKQIFNDPYDVLRLNSEHHRESIKATSVGNYCINTFIQDDFELRKGYFIEYYQEYETIISNIKKLKMKLEKAYAKSIYNRLKEAKKKFKEFMDLRMLELIRKEAKVIVTTFSEAHNLPFQLTFKLVMVDEASYSTQQDIFRAAILTDPNMGKLILFGDIKQLEPFYLHETNREKFPVHIDGKLQMVPKNINLSMHSLLVEVYKYANVHTLMTQKRCVPPIANIMSKLFYNSQIKTCPSVLKDLSRYAFKNNKHLLIVTHDGQEKKEGLEQKDSTNDTSYVNKIEALVVQELIRMLPKKIVTNEDSTNVLKNISVLTFFCSQKYYLNSLNLPVQTSTVHSFQGQESRVVILSCVRQNAFQDLGFIESANLLNTAISRAKDILIIVCGTMFTKFNPSTLWGSFMDEMLQNGCIQCHGAIEKDGTVKICSLNKNQ